MKRILLILFILLYSALSAQDSGIFDSVKNAYESFEYENVISLANLALQDTTQFSRYEREEIFLMKAIAHYIADDEDSVRICFIEILRIDNDYEIDQASVSPKIVDFFEKVKDNFHRITDIPEKPEIKNDPPVLIQTLTDTIFVDKYRGLPPGSYLKSVLLPGLGHFDAGHNTKGWIITGVSAVLIGSIVYYYIETSDRETEYLSETDPELLPSKYDSYNEAYKIRNGLIFGYIAVWIYSQTDLILDGNQKITPYRSFPGSSGFRLNFSYQF